MKQKNIILLVITLLMTTFLQANESGTCGINARWELEPNSGKLIISGTGSIYDYDLSGNPSWVRFDRNKVKSLVVEEGITGIGKYAFYYCENLKKISLPNSLIRIGASSFAGCSSLTNIEIPVAVKYIEHSAFAYCRSIQQVQILSTKIEIAAFAFGYCDDLSSVNLANSNSRYSFTSFPSGVDIQKPSTNTEVALRNTLARNETAKNNTSKTTKKHIDEELPYSSFLKKYVEKGINKWQQKGEFEKTIDWQNRVNENSRQQKINDLLVEAEDRYIAYHQRSIFVNPVLGKYDADNEVFAMTDSQFGTTYMAVPINEAQRFKENWDKKKLSFQLQIQDDQFKLASLSVIMPDGIEYIYRNTDAVNYNQTEIEYNFAPIDLNLAASSKVIPEGQHNVTTTKMRVGKSQVDVNIPEVNKSNPNTFVIIFANEDYKNVASVPFAKNDGYVFQQYCQKTLGIPVNNIHYVENASYNDIRIQLAWLNDVCNAFEGNASLIVYYAGHGIPDEASKSAYLLPVDGDGRYVQSAYKLDDMYQKLGAMSAKSVTVFMDACFSGSKREEGMLASARGVAIRAKAGAPQGNMVVFSAATGDETAYPNNDEQHGMFTYYLLKKLQETKGDVTLQDLGDYIITNVRQQSIVKNGKSQTPTITPSAEASTWQTWKLK